ncbi:hypothetical protein [Piscinibacter terrae]|uniref:Uncharacterized protein n=1 Tax=Piscinibacter terrae TaxID=2496871 RepID=A0A3N7JVD7_9BURK|nr:hypothetical protein [Albitalea terrae]RQP24839.1 hypothetical protein DZC73_08155 [Albitalea terrae]
MSSNTWRTAWHGQEIVVYRDEAEVDRIHASQIEKVIFVYEGGGESPGDLRHAIVETADDCIIFPADTGFAGRVNFERVDYWAGRGCVFWVHHSQAPLPMRMRRGRWWLRMSAGPAYARVPRSELASLIDHWPVEGPQTWDQRKWRRIERNRPFGKREAGNDSKHDDPGHHHQRA